MLRLEIDFNVRIEFWKKSNFRHFAIFAYFSLYISLCISLYIFLRASKARAPPEGGKPARLRKEFIQFFGSRIQKLTNMSLSDVTFEMFPNASNLVKTFFLTSILTWERLTSFDKFGGF